MTKLSLPIYQLKRRAKSMAREQGIPLHLAQDNLARREGFGSWSLLVYKAANSLVGDNILDRVDDGDLVLLAARPGQGKTIIGLTTLLNARRAERRAVLFTLDLTEEQAKRTLEEISSLELAASVEIETSDDIDADYIIAALADAEPGAVAVVDYLQLLDERRSKPPLADQIDKLRRFAASRRMVMVFLSQIDRTFDPAQRTVPCITDVRRPNPLPMEAFNKRLFLHDGKVQMENCSA